MTINNQYPGPLIEANQGDKLEITVNNNLGIPQSIHWHGMRQNIHWHGMRQNGTNDQDGVPGVSQCAIPPGGSFTYRFSLDSEMGTYWYHSHYGNTMADGIVGGIIVHARNDPLRLGIDYDDERMVYLSDWMDD
jgi:FtsP/CotA-like multicopper oxidase with cupredoxin domain